MTDMVSNSVNFGSMPLHQVNLRKGDGSGFVRAVVSELQQHDAGDVKALEKIIQSQPKSKYFEDILKVFIGEKEVRGANHFALYEKTQIPIVGFYAVELEGKKPLYERILGVAQSVFETAINAKNLDLTYLETKPEFMYKDSFRPRTIKGIGEILMAKTVALAKSLEASTVSIESNQDDFYFTSFNNAGVKIVDNREYDFSRNIYVESDNFDKYLDYIDKKYKTRF